MIAIKMRKDVSKLKREELKYPVSFTEYIESYFNQLWKNLRDKEDFGAGYCP